MTIPIQPVNLGNGQVFSGGAAPDPLALLLRAMMQGAPIGADAYQQSQNRKQTASISSAEMDLRKQEMAFRIAQEKTRQEQIKHQQEVARQQGEATKIALGPIMEHLQATGQMAQMLPPQAQPAPAFNPQGPAGQPLPAIQQTPGQPGIAPAPSALPADTRLTQFLATMEPEAAAQFVQEQLPHLMALRQSGMGGKLQQTQAGDQVTVFDPARGFWDAEANGGKGAWTMNIPRRISQDEKDQKALDRQIKLAQIEESRARAAASQDYRTAIRAQTMTRQFDGRTKDLRDRARIIMQAQQTIGDAMNNPDPMQRRVLYSSAIANFVQAADQKAQLRYQLLQYFKKNVDPSIGGSFTTLKTRLLKGELPGYVGQGMLAHLNNLLEMSKSEYVKHREGEIKRHPELANWLPDPDEFFTSEHGTPQGGAPNLDQIFGGVTP